MMAGLEIHNIGRDYPPPNILSNNAAQDRSIESEQKIVLKEPKQEIKEQRISLEELTKAIMKPKEIKRLLYLTIPFTRHLVAELDQNKGNLIDRQG
jgi:hypothetical protein